MRAWRALTIAFTSLSLACHSTHPANGRPLATISLTTWEISRSPSRPIGLTTAEREREEERSGWPTKEDMLNALSRMPQPNESSAEPFSVEEQRFLDRIRTDRIRQLAFGTERFAPARNLSVSRPSIDLELNFEYNSDKIGNAAQVQLNNLGQALSSPGLQGQTFVVAGHTEAQGDDTFAQGLSERRADAVKRFLVEKFGIPAENLVTVGYGKSHLKNPADPLSNENRRIQIINASVGPSCQRGPSSAPYC